MVFLIYQLHQYLREPVATVWLQAGMKVTLDVQEDPETGDLYLQFTEEMLAELGWMIGDELDWIDNKDGSWTLRRKTSTP